MPKERWDKLKFLGAVFGLLALFATAIWYMIQAETRPLKEDMGELKASMANVQVTLNEKVKSEDELAFHTDKRIALKVKKECLK
jgi:Na+-transporting methylmalonyl-CoA/oxaloacetate decarboxylase gamma subunit